MTHKTGPRIEVVQNLKMKLINEILHSGATVGETFIALHGIRTVLVNRIMHPWMGKDCPIEREQFEALHQKEMSMVRWLLAPWEDENCPTCPKGDAHEHEHETPKASAKPKRKRKAKKRTVKRK